MAHAVKDPARPHGGGIALVEPVFQRNFTVCLFPAVTGIQDDNDIIRAVQRFPPVGCGLYFCREIVLGDDFMCERRRQFERFSRDVHQRNSAVPEFGIGQDIGDQTAGENMTACADEYDLGHF